jgi:outer membrane protein OmpA-like peptidoglycan-associated protein
MRRCALILPCLLLGGLVLGACSTSGPYKTRDQLVSNTFNCGERRLEIYFQNDQANLTPLAMTALQLTSDQLKSCQITKVQVTGLSDARGGVNAANQSLSERRATAVADALKSLGLPAPAFEVQASGAAGASSDGINDPLRRRTEVVISSTIPR